MDDALRQAQRRRAMRTALLLALLAIAIYAGFIAMTVHRSRAG